MRSNAIFIKTLILFTTTVSIIFSSACGQKNQNSAPKQQLVQTEEQGDKIPEQLQGIEDNIEKIFMSLNGPSVRLKDEESKGQKKDTAKGEDTKNQGDEESSKEKEGGKESKSQEGSDKESSDKEGSDKGNEKSKEGSQRSQQEKQAQQQPQPQDPWMQITPLVNNLHYQWNSYMASALGKGASKATIDNFSTALNSLTNTIITKNKTNTLMAASYLYAYIPEFYSLYKTQTSPEIKRIRYYIRNSMMNSMTANWVQADTDINTLKSSWALYKTVASKDQQENFSKLEFSIYELEKVTKEKNQPLIDIKGRVALSNVEAIEKALQKETAGSGQSGGNSSNK